MILKLNMQDINKILVNANLNKNDVKKHVSMKLLEVSVMPSLLHHVLPSEKSHLSIFCKCGEPCIYIFNSKSLSPSEMKLYTNNL